jgi:hypothetical protein
LSAVTFAAQPTSLGNVKVKRMAFDMYTLAQINLLQPDTTGQIVGCSDCVRAVFCASSGSVTTTNIGSWVIPVTTGVFTGATFSGMQHCQ